MSGLTARHTFVFAIFVVQILADIAILLDIYIARQVLGFIYLTFVPGAALLILFKMDGLNLAEKTIFSTGLSSVIVMLVGLVLSQVGLSFNFSAALSTPIVLLAMNIAVLFLCTLGYFSAGSQSNVKKSGFHLPWVLTAFLPPLAAAGAYLVNSTGNSIILVIVVGAIASTAILSFVLGRASYSFILLMITIAIILHGSLISNYIVGLDVHPAYQVFKTTQNDGIWHSVIDETDSVVPRLNQMLSLTVNPTIYSNVLGMEGTWVFKIVFPLLFALVPLGFYQLYKRYMDKRIAFAATFFILADITFYREMPGLPSQMLAELFLVLLLMVIFYKEISPSKKPIFFTLFSIGLIVSHYALSYLFMFLIVSMWLVAFLRKKQAKIKLVSILLFFVLAFSWYIYTSHSASFTSLLEMGENIRKSFWSDLLDPQSRPETVLKGLGAGEPATSLGHWLGRGFRYITELFIVLGFVVYLFKHGSNNSNLIWDRDYFVMSTFMLVSLFSIIVAPSFNLLNVTRLYHLSVLFLAPFAITGAIYFFAKLLRSRKSYIPSFLMLIIVVSLFLFETNFVYEVSGDVSYSFSLSMYRMSRSMIYSRGIITEAVDVAGAVWLRSSIVLTDHTLVHADLVAAMFPLTSYGVFPRDQTEILSNSSLLDRHSAYVYLRAFNTLDDKIFGKGWDQGYIWNTSDLSSKLAAKDKIYDNGATEIYFVP